MKPVEPTQPEPIADAAQAGRPIASPFNDTTTIAIDSEPESPIAPAHDETEELPTEAGVTDEVTPAPAAEPIAAQETAAQAASAEPPTPATEPLSPPSAPARSFAAGNAPERSSTFPRPSPAYTLPKMGEVRIGLIGGSGLGEALASRSDSDGRWHEFETPFGKPSGPIFETSWSGLPVFFLSRHGPGHLLNPTAVPYRANLFALKQLGVTHVIASGAVGSLRDHLRPRDLVIADQVIDKTHRRAGTFYERAAVHVEFAEPFCPVLRRILLEAGGLLTEGAGEQSSGGTGSSSSSPELQTPNSELPSFKIHDRGCYVCMEGPAFSTRAESLMHRLWGGDLIGMTAMPEAKLAREAEMSYALVALVTDYDSWRRPGAPQGPGQVRQEPEPPSTDPAVLLKEIIANLQAATDNGVRLIRRAVSLMADRRDDLLAAPAQQALKLAIWSDKSRIPREDVELLGPLWMKYFERQ